MPIRETSSFDVSIASRMLKGLFPKLRTCGNSIAKESLVEVATQRLKILRSLRSTLESLKHQAPRSRSHETTLRTLSLGIKGSELNRECASRPMSNYGIPRRQSVVPVTTHSPPARGRAPPNETLEGISQSFKTLPLPSRPLRCRGPTRSR